MNQTETLPNSEMLPDTEYDVAVVGGSFAGLSAALQLARARRRVLVLDTGKPRNRFARASHGFLGHDGRAPEEILDIARKQLMAYPTAHMHEGLATGAMSRDGVFVVTFQDAIFAGGCETRVRRLILATGMVDHLPDVPGMWELWGEGVNQCPYCHGYEVADRKLAVFANGPEAVHHAALLREWSRDVTLLTHGGAWLTDEDRALLEERGVGVDETPVERLLPSDRKWRERELGAVLFQDGRAVPYGALFTTPRCSFASPLAERLGCEIAQGPFGPIVKTDDFKETTIRGVFAAGDAAAPMASVTMASASGVLAGVAAHRSLVFPS
jgi:thioredoxin reductase